MRGGGSGGDDCVYVVHVWEREKAFVCACAETITVTSQIMDQKKKIGDWQWRQRMEWVNKKGKELRQKHVYMQNIQR